VVLTASGVLLARTFANLATVDLGFVPDRVVVMRLNLPIQLFRARQHSELLFYEEVLRQTRALAGIEAAGFGSRRPLSEAPASVETSRADGQGRPVRAAISSASAGFLATVGARLAAGRDFLVEDPPATPALLINDRLAALLFATDDPIGRRLDFRYFGRATQGVVIGVVHTVRLNGLAGVPPPELVVDYRHRPLIMDLFARTDRMPTDVRSDVTRIIRSVDPTGRVTVNQLATLEGEMARHLARPRFFLVLVGAFGLSALTLAAAGLYGVMAFAFEARRHDLGVRLAVGASPGRLVRDLLSTGVRLTVLGLALGVGAAAATTQIFGATLHGVAPRDPATFLTTTAIVFGVATAACWLPARGASRLSPIMALRAD
jgi:hypothetical protein